MPKKPTTGSARKEVPQHPGQYVRETILVPKKMSVTEAAKWIGISRPNVSNFLNGKAACTADMAERIERAFKIPAKTLLDKQAEYDAAQAKSKGMPSKTRVYVPPFLAIKRNDIEDWATRNIRARTRLSVLLRTLVNSTGVGLTKVDFPGNDDAERPGWDGFVEAAEGTQWIPEGASGWEFGVNENIKGKADDDFAKSVKAIGKAERTTTTFVFVTPRKWPGKTKWAEDKKAKGQWKDVRAYDAQDIEQWLEQSLAGQTWFANETRHPSEGVRMLDKCWADWANSANPPLSEALFNSSIANSSQTMLSLLAAAPDRPTVVKADSADEALAFLSQLFGENGGDQLAAYRDRVLVFDTPGVLPRLAQGTQSFIAVTNDRDIEREFAPHAKSLHSIVIYPRNATVDADIVLESASHETFRTALESMGKTRDDIERLDHESGRSLTVLRRRLSTVPAVRTPEWSTNQKTASTLVPFMFVGAWNADNKTDRLALSMLANDQSYEVLEKDCQQLSQLSDAPVWSVGSYRGVVSKLDLLFAIAGAITADDLEKYFSLAEIVLGEDDPALDLPEDDRWAAALHQKTRDFSAAFREGISETLVLLSVYGNSLLQSRTGMDLEHEATQLINKLLPTPLTLRKLEANDRDLPTYAEAAPNTFLSIIEQDLKTDDPAVLGLLRPADAGVLGSHPSRTGLLWALEALSWNPATLPRAARILARLAEVEIDDNWVNKPINSLHAIFRAWMPQTAASHDDRVRLVKALVKEYPDVAWKICIAQLDTGVRSGSYSHKPRWRADGYGYGEPHETWSPIISFMRESLDLVLSWPTYSRKRVCDLIERIHDLDDEARAKVWEIVQTWAASASDEDRAIVREKMRVTIKSRRGVIRAEKSGRAAMTAEAQATYDSLQPADILNRHLWLFREVWVQESADEFEDDAFDFRKREEWIQKLRVDALREVLEQRGIDGVVELAERGNAASVIGRLLASDLLNEDELPGVLRDVFKPTLADESLSKKNIVFGALHGILDDKKRESVLSVTALEFSGEETARLLLLAPFRRSTWEMVDTLDKAAREIYWAEVNPDWIHESREENTEAVERLLDAQRPTAAFACICLKPDELEPTILYRLLNEMAKGGKDEPGHYRLDRYNIEHAFLALDRSTKVTLEQKAGLEFAYLEALAEPWRDGEYGIPNLEKYIEKHPEVFVQAVVATYKRSDEGEDPEEFKVPADRIQDVATRSDRLLEALKRIPGHNDRGELETDKLATWVKTVRDSCAELGRGDVGDVCLGKLLASAPEGEDGVWPCEPVRQVMEDIQSEKISSGAHTGLYNSRGVVWRGEGGGQERELAEKYRRWADALQYSHPFVASNLLMSMVRTYESEATREDLEAGLRQRLR